jgi:hypothetical protein
MTWRSCSNNWTAASKSPEPFASNSNRKRISVTPQSNPRMKSASPERKEASLPREHDVIVHKTVDPKSENPYGVGIYEGSIQFSAVSEREARNYADRFARMLRVDVWYTEDHQTYSCMSRFRPKASATNRTGSPMRA